MSFEEQAPTITWEEINANAVDSEELDFTVSTATLIRLLQELAMVAPFFHDLTESGSKRLEEMSMTIYTHLHSLPIDSDERAQLTDQLRLTLKTLWGLTGVAAVIYRALPSIHEASPRQERVSKRSRPPQGW